MTDTLDRWWIIFNHQMDRACGAARTWASCGVSRRRGKQSEVAAHTGQHAPKFTHRTVPEYTERDSCSFNIATEFVGPYRKS
jgi:hypothetical protein